MTEAAAGSQWLLTAGNPNDLLLLGDLCLLHCGPGSTAASWLHALSDKLEARAAERIVIVYNPFDGYQSLSDILRLVPRSGTGVFALALDSTAFENPRLVDEYVCSSDRLSWMLVAHDIELYSYLTRSVGIRCAIVNDLSDTTKLGPRQTSNHVLMVAPVAFAFNAAAAEDNRFSRKPSTAGDIVRQNAILEFKAVYSALVNAGVDVSLISEPGTDTPDAVFPNNWFSTHAPGDLSDGKSSVILYPMKAATRRGERRPAILEKIRVIHSYENVLDLTAFETNENAKILEGTGPVLISDGSAIRWSFLLLGSMVLDRVNRICYACLSERTHLELLRVWTNTSGYRIVSFSASGYSGEPIYHTNVMMSIGTGVAVICAEAIRDLTQRRAVLEDLSATRTVLTISLEQMSSFCGNVVELQNRTGRPILAMSSQAFNSFDAEQRAKLLETVDDIVHAPIPTIEAVGGGGVRCMIAELF